MIVLVKQIDASGHLVPLGEDYDKDALGARLAQVRENAGLGQDDLGKMFGKTAQAISHWENGRSVPPSEALILYATRLGVDLNWLITGRAENEVVQAVLKVLAR